MLADHAVGGDFDLSRLSRLRGPLAEVRLVDLPFALPEGNTSCLRAIEDYIAIGLLSLALGPGELAGTHQQDDLDGSASHCVDEVVESDLGVLDENGF